jgi:hypothetical protein
MFIYHVGFDIVVSAIMEIAFCIFALALIPFTKYTKLIIRNNTKLNTKFLQILRLVSSFVRPCRPLTRHVGQKGLVFLMGVGSSSCLSIGWGWTWSCRL